MKQPTGNSSTLFCEQVSKVTLLFEKWNDCERAVVMYALLKRLSFPTLKFLQLSIENNLTNNFGEKNLNSIESNANDFNYIEKLVNAYKTFSMTGLSNTTDKDSILYESDLYLKDSDKSCNKKEDILNDILNMIPLLRPGNDEVKQIYLSLIPLAVEDTVRQLVTAEMVQQIFSYLLIHPAISNEDRRSLSYWLRHLEDHIQSSFASEQRSFYILINQNNTPPESLSSSYSVMNSTEQNSWQAIVPPSAKQHQVSQFSNLTLSSINSSSSSSSDWNLNILQLSQTNKSNHTNSSQNSLGIVAIESNDANTSAEDLHISFSKNGTEVLDFDANSDKSEVYSTQMAAYIGDRLHVPLYGEIENNSTSGKKTKRSNSLTTATASSSSSLQLSKDSSIGSTSTENLMQFSQKQRSFSLSMDSSQNSLQSSGSETRLDELKPNYLKFTTSNIGMSNVGQWLKSLRLHKYIGLFTNITYDDMLQITEDYLQGLGVTKGASHKLALCIEKLKARFAHLSTMEIGLLENKVALGVAIETLANIVLTPMKPINTPSCDNVAKKFLDVLRIVFQDITRRDGNSTREEEHANGLLWILDRALHSEAFLMSTTELKEYKLKLAKMKMQFSPKGYYVKGTSIHSIIPKTRWATSKIRKPDGNLKLESSDKIHRQSSSDMPAFNVNIPPPKKNNLPSQPTKATQYHINEKEKFQVPSYQPSHLRSQFSINNVPCTSVLSSSSTQCKSASYPSFSSAVFGTELTINPQQQDQQIVSNQQQFRYNRYSLNNLIAVPSAHVPQPPLKQASFSSAKCPTGTLMMAKAAKETNIPTPAKPFTSLTSKKCVTRKNNNTTAENSNILLRTTHSRSTTSDINSSLEFLCLQMTEQAIN